jgi:hypothetical protein
MNIHEFDWRIEPLHDVFVGLQAGLATILGRMETEDGFDGGWALDYAEPLLGVGFVAAQAYALGTCSDLNHIRSSIGKPSLNKRACYACDPITVKGNVTRIKL